MKKILSVLLIFALVFGLAACGSSNNSSNASSDIKISDAEKTKRTEYYKTWAASEDFGPDGKYVTMDLKLNDTVFVMETTGDHMLVTVDKTTFTVYEIDKKVYLYTKSVGSDGKDKESWSFAEIPDGAESLIPEEEENNFANGSRFGEVEYVNTVKEGDITYDILDVKGEDMFANDDKDHVYKVYVNAENHKIGRIEISDTMEGPGADGNVAKNIKVTGAVRFTDGGEAFKAPENAEKTQYETLLMTFAFGLMGIMADNPLVSSFMD